MSRTNLNDKSLVANESISIKEALMLITDNQRGAIVVVDDDFIYRGVVSDGEIRRALVHGATQLAPISKIVNLNALFLAESKREEAEKLFKEFPEITLIPILGKGNKVVDVIIRDGFRRKS